MGVGAAHIIPLLAAGLDKFFEMIDAGLVAWLTANEATHVVVDLLATIEGKNGVHVFVVDPFSNFVVQEHAIGGEGDFQNLAELGCALVAIFHHFFADWQIEQRLAAEKIDLNMGAMLRRFHEKIDGFLANLCAHQRATAAVSAAVGEAVAAAQVAVVGHVQAEGFDDRLGVRRKLTEIDVRKEHAFVDQFCDPVGDIARILFAIGGSRGANGVLPRLTFLEGIEEGVDGFVGDMDGTAVHIEHQMQVVKNKSVNA